MSPDAPRTALDWRVALAGGAAAALGLAGFALARDGGETPTPEPIELRTTVLPEPVTVPEAGEPGDPGEDRPGPAAATTTLAPAPPPAPPPPPPPVTAGQVAPAPAPAAPPDNTDDSPDEADDEADDSVDSPD
jgi:hypothetical protein